MYWDSAYVEYCGMLFHGMFYSMFLVTCLLYTLILNWIP